MDRALLPEPERFKPFPALPEDLPGRLAPMKDSGVLLEQLLQPIRKSDMLGSKIDPLSPVADSVLPFKGGEKAALDRLAHYTRIPDNCPDSLPLAMSYKQTRNGLVCFLFFIGRRMVVLTFGCRSDRTIRPSSRHSSLMVVCRPG